MFLHLCYQSFTLFCSVGVATQLPYPPSPASFNTPACAPGSSAAEKILILSPAIQLGKIIHLYKMGARKLLDGGQLNKTLGTNKTHGVP